MQLISKFTSVTVTVWWHPFAQIFTSYIFLTSDSEQFNCNVLKFMFALTINTDIEVYLNSRCRWSITKCTAGIDKYLARQGRKQANVSVRMTWISFGALPCRKTNLMTARVSLLLKSRASLTCFRTCFLPGRAKT